MSKDDSTGKIQWDRLIKKLSPYTVQKGLRYLKHYGLKEFWIRLHERFEPEEVPYGPWYEAYRPDEETLEKQRKRKFPDGPLISIVVPAYLTPERFLRQMLDSLLAQTYENWELCLANGSPEDPDMQTVLRSYAEMDRRIRYQDLKENLGIAENTNAAFAMAEGDFIALLDHDDLLAPNALYEIAAALEEHPEADLAFCGSRQVMLDGVGNRTGEEFDRAISDEHLKMISEDWRDLYIGDYIGAPSATIYRKGAPEYEEKLTWIVDVEFYMRLLQRNPRFVVSKEPLVSIGVSENQLTESCRTDGKLNIFEYGFVMQEFSLLSEEKYRQKFIQIALKYKMPFASLAPYGIPKKEYEKAAAKKRREDFVFYVGVAKRKVRKAFGKKQFT